MYNQGIPNSIQNFNNNFEKLIFYTNFNRFLIDYKVTKIFRYLDGNKILQANYISIISCYSYTKAK